MNPSLLSLFLGSVLSHFSVLLAPLTAVLNLDLLLYLPHQQPWYLNAVAKSGVNWCSAGVEMVCLLWRKNMEKRKQKNILLLGKQTRDFSASLTGEGQLKTDISVFRSNSDNFFLYRSTQEHLHQKHQRWVRSPVLWHRA